MFYPARVQVESAVAVVERRFGLAYRGHLLMREIGDSLPVLDFLRRHPDFDVVPLLGERGPDVIVSALDAPATAREGQDIALGVIVRSSFATTGRLQIVSATRAAKVAAKRMIVRIGPPFTSYTAARRRPSGEGELIDA